MQRILLRDTRETKEIVASIRELRLIYSNFEALT